MGVRLYFFFLQSSKKLKEKENKRQESKPQKNLGVPQGGNQRDASDYQNSHANEEFFFEFFPN